MGFTGSNFTKYAVVQRISLDISCIECYPKLKKITEHNARFHLRPYVMWAVYYVILNGRKLQNKMPDFCGSFTISIYENTKMSVSSMWRIPLPNLIYRVIQNDCRGTNFQRQFRTKFGEKTQSDNYIRRCYEHFQETVCGCI